MRESKCENELTCVFYTKKETIFPSNCTFFYLWKEQKPSTVSHPIQPAHIHYYNAPCIYMYNAPHYFFYLDYVYIICRYRYWNDFNYRWILRTWGWPSHTLEIWEEWPTQDCTFSTASQSIRHYYMPEFTKYR